MLEGKELEGKIGEYGGYSVDVTDKGIVDLGVSLKFDLIAELEKLALLTTNTIDDKMVAMIKSALGR